MVPNYILTPPSNIAQWSPILNFRRDHLGIDVHPTFYLLGRSFAESRERTSLGKRSRVEVLDATKPKEISSRYRWSKAADAELLTLMDQHETPTGRFNWAKMDFQALPGVTIVKAQSRARQLQWFKARNRIPTSIQKPHFWTLDQIAALNKEIKAHTNELGLIDWKEINYDNIFPGCTLRQAKGKHYRDK